MAIGAPVAPTSKVATKLTTKFRRACGMLHRLAHLDLPAFRTWAAAGVSSGIVGDPGVRVPESKPPEIEAGTVGFAIIRATGEEQ